MLKMIIALAVAVVALPAPAGAKEPTRYVKTPTGYMMVLRRGDDVIANLES